MNNRKARNGLTVRQVSNHLGATAKQYSSIANGLKFLEAANILQMQKFGRTVKYLLSTNPHQTTSDDKFKLVYHQIGRATYKQDILDTFDLGEIDIMVLVDFGTQEYRSHRQNYRKGKNINIA
jgi:transcriptional regulator with XRE-family HTH domain